MSKILFVSDIHIGHYQEFDVNGSRLRRSLTALEEVLAYATDPANDIDRVIDLGDLIDRKNLIDFSVYNALCDLFERYLPPDNPEFFSTLVGNHNFAVRDGSINNLRPMKSMINIIDTTSVLWSTDHEWKAMAIPFQTSISNWVQEYARACEVQAGHDNDGTTTWMLLAHQEITGAQTGTHRYTAKEGLDLSKLPGPFDWALFGHYHLHQKLHPQVWYVGALLQQGFGEELNAQGFWTYETAHDRWDWIPVGVPIFQTVSNVNDVTLGNFTRLRANVVAGDIPEELLPFIRIEPSVDADTNNARLQPDSFASFQGLVSSYIQQFVPPEFQQGVRDLVTHMETDRG